MTTHLNAVVGSFLCEVEQRLWILEVEEMRRALTPGLPVWKGRKKEIYVQGSAEERSLGCVIPASRPPLAAGARFTQPRDHSLTDPCRRIAGVQLGEGRKEDESAAHLVDTMDN